MKKLLYLVLISGFLFTAAVANAQFGSIPGAVTDSFKVKYPNAQTVSWSGIGPYKASFTLEKEKYTSKFNKKGQWLESYKEIAKDALPTAVKDGLTKSKYATSEWEIRTVTVRYTPGDTTQYILLAAKNDIQKRNLVFSADGRLLKDGNTL